MTAEAEEEEEEEGNDSTQQPHRDDREIMQMLEMRVVYCTLCHEGNVKRNDLNTH